MSQNIVQPFFIDKQKVKSSPQVNVSAVELYFKRKPPNGLISSPNVSGIQFPGVNLHLCGINSSGKPDVTNIIKTSRLEYAAIPISGDASAPAKFVFPKDFYVDTDTEYAFIVQFDGYEDFVLWTNAKDSYVIGTTTKSTGTADPHISGFYTYQPGSTSIVGYNPAAAGSVGIATQDTTVWTSHNNETLKFNVYVCRFSDAGTVIPGAGSNTSLNGGGGSSDLHMLTMEPYEFLLYDKKYCKKDITIKTSEYVYQNTAMHPGTAAVLQNSLQIIGTGVDFTALYGATTGNPRYIVLISKNDDPTHPSGNPDKINIRRIASINSNNSITLDRYPTITNAVSNFLIPTPVGRISSVNTTLSFVSRGNTHSWYYGDRNKQDFVVLYDSNANSTVRFVNNSIESVAISTAGGSYTNGDVLTISSASPSSLNAIATITTSNTGNVVSTYLSNTGFGMLLAPTFSVSNSTGGASTGSGATFTFTEGPQLISEFNKYIFKDTEVVNWGLTGVNPVVDINNQHGISFTGYFHTSYYKDSSNSFNILENATADKNQIKIANTQGLLFANTPLILSKSNECSRSNTHSITLANGTSVSTKTSTVIEIVANSTFDFVCPSVSSPLIVSNRYIINNDYTNENTPFGNALAKHISSKISFQQGRIAEDIIVYLRAYRPANTDIKVFARLYNSNDPQAFDDKDWSLLVCKSGNTQFSSSTDTNDLVELTYGLPAYPNTYFTSPGVITTTNNNTTIIGTNTSFTSGIYGFGVGDLVKIYSPIFPVNYMITTVSAVANATSLTVSDPVSNVNVIGSGLLIDKLQYKNQAFNNVLNNNVARYYNTSMHGFDNYDTFSIKMVMLSTTDTIVPQIDDIRAIGVSA